MFEMKSLFFSLMKRTKNQGCGIVVKAQNSELLMISLRCALFCSLLKFWFCRWSSAKLPTNSSISVRSQNPTIPRPEVILNWEILFINEINFRTFKDDLKWNLCSFPWWKEPKIKAVVLLLKRKFRNYWWFRSDALYFIRSWKTDFVGDLLRSFRQKSSFSVHK